MIQNTLLIENKPLDSRDQFEIGTISGYNHVYTIDVVANWTRMKLKMLPGSRADPSFMLSHSSASLKSSAQFCPIVT